MRVGIDARPLQFESSQRGIGRFVRELVLGLTELSPDDEFLLIHFGSVPFTEELAPGAKNLRKVALTRSHSMEEALPKWARRPRVMMLPWLPTRLRRGFLAAQREDIVELLKRERIDVVHYPAPLEHWMTVPLENPVPSVSTFHDAIPLVFPEQFLPKWDIGTRYEYEVNCSSYRSATKIGAVSESAKQDVNRYLGIELSKVSVVYPSADSSFGSHVSLETIEATLTRLRVRQPFFLFCSAVDWHKNMQRIVPALGMLRERLGLPYQLVVAGSQLPSMRERVRDLCFDEGFSGRDVVMAGYVSDEELRALYQSCVALVAPSLYEGFGIPPVEAMASGAPVIVSNRSAQPEVVGDAGLQVDPESISEIADAMAKLATEEELRRTLSAKGPDRAKRFNNRNQAEGYLRIYREALNLRTGS